MVCPAILDTPFCFVSNVFLVCGEPAEGVEDTYIGLAEVAREVEVVVR